MSTREWFDQFEREENLRQERLEKLKEDVVEWRKKLETVKANTKWRQEALR